jgi:hypothetical protein
MKFQHTIKGLTLLFSILIYLMLSSCITTSDLSYKFEFDPNSSPPPNQAKMKEILIVLQAMDEYGSYAEWKGTKDRPKDRKTEYNTNPEFYEFMNQLVSKEIEDCNCVTKVLFVITKDEKLDELKKLNKNLILVRLSSFQNSALITSNLYFSALTLLTIPTWNSYFHRAEVQIYSEKSKAAVNLLYEKDETAYRHFFLFPFLYTSYAGDASFGFNYTGVFRSSVEYAYKNKMMPMEKKSP